tara:strand:+ start:166526 stop:166948 length:423 start_codon:yes stop_codon:yes gene_type:complete
MSLRGRCNCGNIQLVWQTVDYSVVPRACQCAYCRVCNANYVSKTGTGFQVTIRKASLHQIDQQGAGFAEFHSCVHCARLVFVSAEIGGDIYGAIESSCLQNPMGFAQPVKVDPAALGVEEKQTRWQHNWCDRVSIRVQER